MLRVYNAPIQIITTTPEALRVAMKAEPDNEGSFVDADYNEIEIGPAADAEYDLANLRLEAFIAGEREQSEILERELDDELNQLILTLRKGKQDPPGWPDF